MGRTPAILLFLLTAMFSLSGCGPNNDRVQSKMDATLSSIDQPTLWDPKEAYPEKALPFIKIPPHEDDAVDRAIDSASCDAAGGDWGDIYQLGTLQSPNSFSDADWGNTPEEERKSIGKRCWSRPVLYADGGKSCRDQADCEMNCIAARKPEGGLSPPQCQASNWHQPNCEAIVVEGQLVDVGCWAP